MGSFIHSLEMCGFIDLSIPISLELTGLKSAHALDIIFFLGILIT